MENPLDQIANRETSRPEETSRFEQAHDQEAEPFPQRSARQNEVEDEIVELEEIELKYGAQHVIKLFVPVSLCMVVVVATVSSISFYTQADFYLLYTPFHEKSEHWQDNVLDAFLNAAIILTLVISLTIVLIFLYKQRCYLIIKVWLGLSSMLLLSFFTVLYLMELLKTYNVGMDWVTLGILIWNFEVVGMVCIHWKGPLILQQAYLIYIAAIMSLIFIKYLPEYTLWVVLAVISAWDLVAVLAPKGPLKILVETAQERNEPIFPALIYSSNIMYSILTATDGEEVAAPARMSGRNLGGGSNEPQRPARAAARPKARDTPTNGASGRVSDAESGFGENWQQQSRERTRRRQQQVEGYVQENPDAEENARHLSRTHQVEIAEMDDENRGVKLGLGDFIFYSVLVGKASSYGDWNTTFACFIAILIGLCLTLILLAILKKALPALPFSITFGLIFYFYTSLIVVPFTERLTIEQVFI